ncbi:exodeoxyribonuclease III [Alphaproteobacteria bacterium]|nr:exodeoxyribonuclease III [Alphaproteobacteria bacterium]
MTTIAIWNVNSVRARIENIKVWLEKASPDILLMQEIKCQHEQFPALDFQAMGYHSLIKGQKSYHGVAILSKQEPTLIMDRLPGEDEDEQARYLEADIGGIRAACLYLPNGNPIDTEKFPYKLRWMERLKQRMETLLAEEIPAVFGGDYNVCPTNDDCYDPVGFSNDALCQPESRSAFRSMLNLGMTEAFRTVNKTPHTYSYWDYTGGAYQKDHGVRIDHFLMTPQAADLMDDCVIDREPRAQMKASDHTPVILTLRDAA